MDERRNDRAAFGILLSEAIIPAVGWPQGTHRGTAAYEPKGTTDFTDGTDEDSKSVASVRSGAWPLPDELAGCDHLGYLLTMTTLLEIESAAKELPASQKEALLLFLADALRSERDANLPAPRKFSGEEITAWIAEDESDFRRIKANRSGA